MQNMIIYKENIYNIRIFVNIIDMNLSIYSNHKYILVL